ncbi:MAG TPA: iron-containing alcohol dehydrogenase [Opitutaceae bacterium]|nr:iron-containing alcohol dehydrogenase [Opitutaceae bacterium]
MPHIRSITLLQPARIVFGAGSAAESMKSLAQAGHRRALLVTSRSVREQAEPLATKFTAAGVLVEIVDNISPEPTAAACEELRKHARAFSPDLVIAIGGGSVLDVAKLAAALLEHNEPIAAFYGTGLVQHRNTALVCVPTTAGTGSEVSPNALVYDEASRAKKAVISDALVPDSAIIDPELTRSLPPALTATTGIDALAHCLETYANRAAHPAVDLRSLEGVRLIGANLTRAVADGADLAARSAIALGSLYGGLGLGPVNTAGIHALAYPLGGEFHFAHGLSIALLLPHVVRFNAPAMPARYTALARALGATSSASDEALAAECADQLEGLLDACRIPRGLGAHGVPRDALPRLANDALQVTRLLKNNPREITRDDALAIYAAAF